MAQTAPIFSVARRNAALDALLDALNGGYLDVYNGTRPADTTVAVTTQTKLVRFSFATPAFGAASSGAKALSGTLTATVLAGGTPTWARGVTSAGVVVVDIEVACALLNGVSQDTSTANVVLSAGPLVQGADCSVSSLTFSEP